MRPCQTYHVLEELRRSVVAPLYRKAVQLSWSDSQTVLRVYQQWLALLIDLDYLHPVTLSRDGLRLWLDLTKGDVLDVNSCFAECLAKIYRNDARGLKSLCSGISSHLYPLLKEDIIKMSTEDCVESAKKLIQVFAFTSRLTLNDIDLTTQMIDDYLAVEESLDSKPLPDYISTLNKILKKWIGPYCQTAITPRHSSGGIAEKGRCSLAEKYMLLGTDPMIAYCFDLDLQKGVGADVNGFRRVSRTIFVPKSYKTFRTISMEPSTLMFYQQGVLTAIDEMVSRSHYLCTRMGTHDQERNRQLAQVGSYDRFYSTIDLSSASDSVSYRLVKQLFRGTWLLRYLVCLRSPKTDLPNGRTVSLKKFAPMGSALCFPIETFIFAAVCEMVTRERHFPGEFSVYGDDIIVPLAVTDKVIEVLSELGFTTNVGKTFSGDDCWFRESCGGEYIKGQDVTPLRISRKYDAKEDDKRFTSLIELSNAAYIRGFRTLRYCYLADMRRQHMLPLFSQTSLLGDSYTNYHLQKRQNKNLQLEEFRHSALKTKYKDPINTDPTLLEEIRLRHWLLSTSTRKLVDFWRNPHPLSIELIGDGYKSEIRRSMTIVTLRWSSTVVIDHDDVANDDTRLLFQVRFA